MAHKDRRKWKPWQAKRPNEPFTPITESMRKHPAYRALNAKQRDLLMLCWIQGNPKSRGNAHLPRDDFPDVDKFKHENVFYMCRNKAVQDNIYTSTNRRYYDDMDALEKYGFIEKIRQGHKGTQSIYKLSANWQNHK